MKRLNLLWCVALVAMVMTSIGCSSTNTPTQGIITVENGQFMRNGEPYYFVGTNFWYGAILGSEGEGGNRERLLKELDFMKANGIDNLRILVGGEGENGLLGKIEPNLQPEPGVYNDEVLAGLDYLMMELGKRNMTAVLYFNNAWEWSGGYTQYVAWANETPVLVPRVDGWFSYNTFAGEFVRNERAKQIFYDHVKYIVSRTNRYTGIKYIDDPAIFSWQISNEPRAFSSKEQDNKEAFAEWIESSAKLIRELDPKAAPTDDDVPVMRIWWAGFKEWLRGKYPEIYQKADGGGTDGYNTADAWQNFMLMLNEGKPQENDRIEHAQLHDVLAAIQFND